jgi:hypothetical protein
MNKKPVYVKCPRCELNYINKKDKLCNICKAELNQPPSFYSTSDEAEDNLLELCPVCKSNYISFDEDICEKCRSKESGAADDEDENWRSFLDDDADGVAITTEDGIEIPLSKLEEEELEKDLDGDFFDEEEEEPEEDYKNDEDDFEELDEDFDEDFDDEEEDDEGKDFDDEEDE